MHSVDFLDVNLDLKTGLYKPCKKPNHTPLYVHSLSNHPKKVLDNIPLAVNKRLCKISSNERVFKEAAPEYQEALNKSGYTHTLVYSKIEEPPKSKNKQN